MNFAAARSQPTIVGIFDGRIGQGNPAVFKGDKNGFKARMRVKNPADFLEVAVDGARAAKKNGRQRFVGGRAMCQAGL